MSDRDETWDDWIADGRAIRYHSPKDFGWDGLDRRIFLRTKADGLDMIIRPSSTPGIISIFVGNNLIHIPAADVERITTVMLRAAGVVVLAHLEAQGWAQGQEEWGTRRPGSVLVTTHRSEGSARWQVEQPEYGLLEVVRRRVTPWEPVEGGA